MIGTDILDIGEMSCDGSKIEDQCTTLAETNAPRWLVFVLVDALQQLILTYRFWSATLYSCFIRKVTLRKVRNRISTATNTVGMHYKSRDESKSTGGSAYEQVDKPENAGKQSVIGDGITRKNMENPW